MSKKLDLNSYLNKYANNTDLKKKQNDIPFQPSQSNYRNTQKIPQKQQMQLTDNYFKQEPIKTYGQTFTGFQRAQLECIQQLEEIKKTLLQQEKQMIYFMQNYYKKVHENMLRQHIKMKDQLLDMFQRSFEQNERKIQQSIRNQCNIQPIQFTNIRKRIDQINVKIQKLEQGLRSQHYRATIAEVVTSDFQNQIAEIQNIITNCQKNYMEKSTNLSFDQIRYNRIQDDLQNLLILDDVKKPPLQQSQLKRQNRSKPSLFTSVPNPHQNRDLIQGNSNFFNFNS